MRKLTAIAIALGLTCADVWLPCARAATIDTYDFTQGGYTFNGSPFLTAVLTGSFTGNVESSGFIEIADLSSINVTFTITTDLEPVFQVFGFGPATFFSFDTAQGPGSLDFETAIGDVGGAVSCVGAVAAFGFGACGLGGVNGFVSPIWATQALPVVSLVSSVTIVPEPSTWAMMLLGFAGLGYAGYRASRRTAAAAA
jgi:PEP-CTERM motif